MAMVVRGGIEAAIVATVVFDVVAVAVVTVVNGCYCRPPCCCCCCCCCWYC